MTIGITDCSKYPNYEKWLLAELHVEVIKLGYANNNLQEIKKCHGILLSGGEDIHPRFYKKPEYEKYCIEIDERRDEFEWQALEYTEANQIPVLGICRGLQVANVFYGGTLIPDIPSSGKPDHSKFQEGKDRYHKVIVKAESELREITGKAEGEINSAHHQSADVIAATLTVSSISEDGIVEGLERKEKGKAFLQLVQWHPERMTDLQSVFSANIKKSFLKAVFESMQVKEI
jgi:putative glutamine amidotransferase